MNSFYSPTYKHSGSTLSDDRTPSIKSFTYQNKYGPKLNRSTKTIQEAKQHAVSHRTR